MIYLDSSALVKLVVAEPESPSLSAAVSGADLVSSELALTEVARAVWRVRIGRRAHEQRALLDAQERLLARLAYVPMGRELLVAAGIAGSAVLRTLDAIHVVSALLVADDLDAFVTYDARQQDAVELCGLPLLVPGNAR